MLLGRGQSSLEGLASGRLADFMFRYRDHVRLMWGSAPGWSTVSLVATLVGAGSLVLSMIATGQLVGALYDLLANAGHSHHVWRWFIIFVLTAILGQLLQAVMAFSDPRIWAAYRVQINDMLAESGMQPSSLSALDGTSATELENMIKNSRQWMFRFGMTGTWRLLQIRLVGLGSVIVLLGWRWWVPLVVAAAFLVSSRLLSAWLGGVLDGMWGTTPPIERQRADYVAKIMSSTQAAKEVRLFGLVGWLADRYRAMWTLASAEFWRRSNRKLAPTFIGALVLVVVLGGALALLAGDAYRGSISTASTTTYALALLALNAFGMQGDQQTGLIQVTEMLRNLRAFRVRLGLPPMTTTGTQPQRGNGPGGGADVSFDDVSFTYPSRERPTLHHLNLHIPTGQSIAIVGVNGAGKSTLIKLLAGLYRAQHGKVTIDGKDAFTDPQLRGRVAVIFQDFVHYPLSLRDNVGFGALERRSDIKLLEQAMVDAAGLTVLERLDHNWDTVLSHEYQGGTDLSGGQWQRVALARALAAVGAGARVLVLDEPTAALDVRAEAELFDRFLDVTQGVTTVLVSHRLATVRRADRIVVLDGATGNITEDGSHEELLAQGGEYATMFRLQAKRFAQAGDVVSERSAL